MDGKSERAVVRNRFDISRSTSETPLSETRHNHPMHQSRPPRNKMISTDLHLESGEGIVLRNGNINFIVPSFVWRSLWSAKGPLEVCQVVWDNWLDGNVGSAVFLDVSDFASDTLCK